MTTIKHPLYKQFKDEGIINPIDTHMFLTVHERIEDKIEKLAHFTFYYTGARATQLNPDVFNTSNYTITANALQILIPPAKHGLPFTFYIPISRLGVKEAIRTIKSLPPNYPLFNKLITPYKRTIKNKKGDYKVYYEWSDKFRYHFRKWYSVLDSNDPIPPYFLRHSRFSSMSMAGAPIEQIRLAKGSKSMSSVIPYVHMSAEQSKKISRFIK